MHRRQDWNVKGKIEKRTKEPIYKINKRIRPDYYVMCKKKCKHDCKEVSDLATAKYSHKNNGKYIQRLLVSRKLIKFARST